MKQDKQRNHTQREGGLDDIENMQADANVEKSAGNSKSEKVACIFNEFNGQSKCFEDIESETDNASEAANDITHNRHMSLMMPSDMKGLTTELDALSHLRPRAYTSSPLNSKRLERNSANTSANRTPEVQQRNPVQQNSLQMRRKYFETHKNGSKRAQPHGKQKTAIWNSFPRRSRRINGSKTTAKHMNLKNHFSVDEDDSGFSPRPRSGTAQLENLCFNLELLTKKIISSSRTSITDAEVRHSTDNISDDIPL